MSEMLFIFWLHCSGIAWVIVSPCQWVKRVKVHVSAKFFFKISTKETCGGLTDVAPIYSLIWCIHCSLNPNLNDPLITEVTLCFHELGCNEEGLNTSLSAGKVKKIPLPISPNNIPLIPCPLTKIKSALLPMLIRFSVCLVGVLLLQYNESPWSL